MANYTIADGKNLIEGLSKEEIENAIQSATGNAGDTAPYVRAVVDQNTGAAVYVWVGTSAQYNAIEYPDSNTLYLVTDDTLLDDLQEKLVTLTARVEALELQMASTASATAEVTESEGEPLQPSQAEGEETTPES